MVGKSLRNMTHNDWKNFAKNHKKHFLIVFGILAALTIILSFGLKSIAVIIGLILFGAASTLFITYTGIHWGNDFTLFGAIVGSFLFGPLTGAFIALAEYAALYKFVPKDSWDIPVGIWYAITAAVIMPKLGFGIDLLQLSLATIIGELGNDIYWTFQGFALQSQLVVGLMKLAWYLFAFIFVLPELVAFLA